MAATVTRLLTNYGAPITMVRRTNTFNQVTGKNTASTSADVSAVGVWQAINSRLVDGTRIKTGDRFLIIDATNAPLMGDTVADWSVTDIEEIKPASVVLAYRMVMRK